jgi:hypothetical protein
MLQSVRRHSAIIWTVTVNDMQEIHPVIYPVLKLNHDWTRSLGLTIHEVKCTPSNTSRGTHISSLSVVNRRWRCWLSLYVTSREVAGSIPHGDLENFQLHNPAALWPWGRLRLLQKWIRGIFHGGKGGRCVGLTTLPPSCSDCVEL